MSAVAKIHAEIRPARDSEPESRFAPFTASGVAWPKTRPLLGVAVAFGTMLLQAVLDFVGGREGARIIARIVFLCLELPILMVALSLAFGWALRRRASAARGLVVGISAATLIGGTLGFAYGLITDRVPDLRFLHIQGTATVLRSTLFGALNAQLYAGLWALAFLYPFAVETAHVRSLEAKQLRSEAELTRLRSHLEPHFLLNTLNAIAGLVTEEPREARRLIACLGDLLRDAVRETSDVQPLGRQIEWLRRYAEILQARHRGSLTFEWSIGENTDTAALPRFLLQPLVENAVKHGALQRKDGSGKVIITTEFAGDQTLICTISDNGPGMPEGEAREGAFGLHAVKRRLEIEVPGSEFQIESSSQGTKTRVLVPRVTT